MDFYLILQEIMDENQLNIPAVARKCGLSDGTVRSIIKRKQKNVALEVAFKLSDGLNVSLERLNGSPERAKAPTPDESKADARLNKIINRYHSLNLKGQLELANYAEYLTTKPEFDKHSNISSENLA